MTTENIQDKVQEIEQVDEKLFPFTNYTDADFTTMWDSIEYVFPAKTTVSLTGLIPNVSLEQIQNIRKMFAKKLATLVFYGSKEFSRIDVTREESVAGHIPGNYVEADLQSFIAKCLEPLPVKGIKGKDAKSNVEKLLSVDSKGKRVSKVVGETTDLNAPSI